MSKRKLELDIEHIIAIYDDTANATDELRAQLVRLLEESKALNAPSIKALPYDLEVCEKTLVRLVQIRNQLLDVHLRLLPKKVTEGNELLVHENKLIRKIRVELQVARRKVPVSLSTGAQSAYDPAEESHGDEPVSLGHGGDSG